MRPLVIKRKLIIKGKPSRIMVGDLSRNVDKPTDLDNIVVLRGFFLGT
jgi:hypothetical protein